MLRRRFWSTTVAVLAACFACLLSSSAWAQSIAFASTPTRKVNDRLDLPTTQFSISRSDCLQDDVWHFPLTITNGIGYSLEIWVGQGSNDCTLATSRTGTAPLCTKVSPSVNVTGTYQTVDVRAQDIAQVASGLYGDRSATPGTAADCTPTMATSLPQNLILYFMLFTGGQATPTAVATWPPATISTNAPFALDLVGPSPPTGVTAQGASTFIALNWTINADPDVHGYQFFCDPTQGGATAGGPDAATVALDASGATCSTSDAGTSSDAGDDGSDGADSSSTTTDAGTCEAGPVTTCGGSKGALFVPNVTPGLDVLAFSCGNVGGNTTTNAKVQGFSTFTTVAVSVASTDLVGNVGPLSPVQCATTEPVNGFIDLYHQAGGTAGGGFCSMTARSGRARHNEFLYGSLVLGAICALRLRRRRTSI